MKPITSSRTAQRGTSLIEALISLLVLALGGLELAAVQARMLVETRTTNSRATAVRLIGELDERILLNAQGAQPGANPAFSATLSPYSDKNQATFPAPAATNPAGCDPLATPAQPCSPIQQAAYDVWVWRTKVANSLMNGTASVFQISPQQLQVVVAWQANENTDTTLNGAAPAAAQQVASQLQITGAAVGATQCATGPTLCHIDFIDIPAGQ